ncbi:cation:proton antiporter [Massilia sp. erpn]|uniref:cation:proton antiporter n=1 Tax=Massilia sp. erpn TaxID=2738142 RepID=UPI0021066331|nr:cation:proton antiporter [Massilia sp. erpn]UTY59276.1 sodium:proton antiporter [Massilia sp. erpn]
MSTASQVHAVVGVHQTEALLFFILLQLTVIVLVARLGTELAVRVGQSAVVGEIVVGILLGPSLFGLLAPDLFSYVFRSSAPEPMQMMSQIGLVLLMFQIGLEFDFAHLSERSNRKAVVWIAIASLVLPFAIGVSFGYFSAPSLSPAAERVASALFMGTAFSITAMPVLGRIMMELNLTRAPLGVIAISAAAINDVVGWLLLALVTAFAVSDLDALSFSLKVGAVLSFMLFCWIVVRPVLKWIFQRADVAKNGMSANLLGIVLAVIFLGAMATYQLGIFAIFGGFMMGVVLHDQGAFVDAWKTRISPFVMVFFLPIFFTYTGLRTDIGGLDSTAAWGWCVLTVALATLGKYGGAYFAARMAGLSRHEANAMGVMMNTRGLMELIIINVGYDLGVISQQTFTILVIMAIVSNVMTGPCLRRWLPRMGLTVPARAERTSAGLVASQVAGAATADPVLLDGARQERQRAH